MILRIAVFGLLAGFVSAGALAQTGLALPILADIESRQISVKVGNGLKSTRSLPRQSLRQARLEMLAKHVVSDEDLRALANYGDGLAALKYVRLLVSRYAGQPEHASDIAYYGAIAVGSGRVWPLEDMVLAMRALSPDTEPPKRINKYFKVLYAHAWAGNSIALDALVDFNGEGMLFGKLLEKTRLRIVEQSVRNGGGRAELRLAVRLMSKPQRSVEESELVRGYLTRAIAANDLAVRTTAQNLMTLLNGSDT